MRRLRDFVVCKSALRPGFYSFWLTAKHFFKRTLIQWLNLNFEILLAFLNNTGNMGKCVCIFLAFYLLRKKQFKISDKIVL